MLTCFALTMALIAAPQEPDQQLHNGVRMLSCQVAGATAEAFALLVPVGFDHDPAGAAGMAEAVARCLLAQAAAELPKGAKVVHSVQGTCTLFQCLVDKDAAPAGLRWCAGLLRPLQDHADRAAMALAQAALLADDAEEVYPGPMLQSRLRRVLYAGTPLGRWQSGNANELQAVDRQRLCAFTAAAHGPGGAILAAIGGADPAVLASGAAVLAAVPERGQRPRPVLRPVPAAASDSTTNRRTDGVFVGAGLRAPLPGDPQLLPFALGIEVLRMRAMEAFREHRGGEANAAAPFVLYDLLACVPLAVVCRRGRNGMPEAGPRAEVEELLEHLRRAPPRPKELQGARIALQTELMAPPYPREWLRSLAAEPTILLTRARALALLAHTGLLGQVGPGLATADETAVATALRPALEPAALAWHAIVPLQAPPR